MRIDLIDLILLWQKSHDYVYEFVDTAGRGLANYSRGDTISPTQPTTFRYKRLRQFAGLSTSSRRMSRDQTFQKTALQPGAQKAAPHCIPCVPITLFDPFGAM